MAFPNAGEEHPASVMSGYNLMRSDSGSQDAESNGNICLHSYSHSKSWEKVRFSLILLISEKYMLIILRMCSCNTKKLYQYSWQWQYLPVVTCQCKYFAWSGEHLSWCKYNIRNCSPSLQLLSPHAPRHLAMFLSDPDGVSAPTLPLYLLAFSCSCFTPS